MSYEDLLVTNSFQNIPSPEKSYIEQRDNRPHYEQLLRGKETAKRQYGPLNPPFTQEQIIDRRLGVSIPETSPGLDQYIDLSMRDTRKKIKKTIVNVDSRNRVKRATYHTETTVAFERRQSSRFPEKGSLFYVPGKSPYLYIYILSTEIGDLYNKQCILDGTFTTSDQMSLANIGINQDTLLFKSEQNGPILNIHRFLYDPAVDDPSTVFVDGQETPITSLQTPLFDPIRQVYRFNVVECVLPTSVVITSLYEGYVFGSSVHIRLISFLKTGYTNSSHYKMSLGRSFSNVYAIRLLSTEIPNTAYTFTGTSITDSIQGRPISTRVNNKLRWIYKNDAVQQFGTSVYAGNLFMRYVSYIQGLEPAQETHYNNTTTTLYQGTSLDTLRLRDSHQFVHRQTTTSSTIDDYYVSDKYIGQLTDTSVLPPEHAFHNVVFQPHPYLFPQISSTITPSNAYYFDELVQLSNLPPTTFTISQLGIYRPSPVSFQWVFATSRIPTSNPFSPLYFTCRVVDTYGQSLHTTQWTGYSSTISSDLTILDCILHRGNLAELVSLATSSTTYRVILTTDEPIPSETLFTWSQHDPTLFDVLQRYYTTSFVCPQTRLSLLTSNAPSPTDTPRMVLSCERGNTISYQSSYRDGANLVIPITAIRPEDRDQFSSKRFTYVVLKQSQTTPTYGFPIINTDTTSSRDSYQFTLFPPDWDISGLDTSSTSPEPIVCDFQEWNHKLVNKLYTSYLEPLTETPSIMEYVLSTTTDGIDRIRYLAVSASSNNTVYHNEYTICYQSDTLAYSSNRISELSVQSALSLGGVYGGAEYKTFFRPGLFTSMPNILYTPEGLSVSSAFSTNHTIESVDPYVEQSADETNVDISNTYRIPYYGFVALRKNNLQTGLIQSQYSTEYVQQTTEQVLPTTFPSHQTISDKLFAPFSWSDPTSQTILSSLGEGADSLYTRYPVYEHTIEPGKYNDATFVKYMNTELNTIPVIGYDYSEEIFVQPDIIQRSPIQQTTQDNTMERRMVVEVDKSIGKIKFTQYKKIFQPSSNQTTDTRTVVYLNEGFPYVCLKIPDVSLANHQFIRVEGMSSIDNIDASQFNTNFYVVKPTTYKTVFRQLLPLPKIDYLNSHQNLFPQESYIRRTVDTLIAPYADYVNASLQRTSTRDLKRTWVAQQYQQDWLEHILGKETVSVLTGGHLNRESHWNTATLDKQSLKQSFLTEYGKGESYPSFGTTPIVSSNLGGAEYIGSSFTNGSRNQRVYNESTVDSTILVQNGLETTFVNNELFMRLTSHETKQHTVIGRIIQLQTTTNGDGNIECMYDLFSENGNNFQIGDIIIGLDSQTIGIILPSDYSFGGLPNRDVLDLGMGAYLYHRNQGELQHFFNELSDTGGNYQLLQYFIQMLSTWSPPSVSLSDHFYIRVPTLPNTSRLNGILTSNIVVYTPCLFRFLSEGDDNPLSKLGVDLSTIGDSFRYFYDNTVAFEKVNIHRSYIIQSDFHDTFIMVDTNTKGQFSVGDIVYFEDHTITPAYLKTIRETVFDVVSYQPFWSWLASLEQEYHRWSPLDSTWKDYTFGIYPTPETYGPTLQTIPFKNDYVLRKWNTPNTTYVASYYGYYTDSSESSDHSFATPTTYYLHVAWDGTTKELTTCKVVYADQTVDLLSSLDIQQSYHLSIEDTSHKSILFVHDYGTQRTTVGSGETTIRFQWTDTETSTNTDWTPLTTKLRLQLKVIRRSVALSANNTYQPLGFFERLMDTYLHSVWNTYSDDIVRANRIYNEYCYNIYKNRILRIKVCPLDSKGFSAELYDPISYSASSSTDGTTRTVANAYRKLFPYHQWNFLYNYKNNPEGETVTIGGIPYQTYVRPYQTKDKSDVYSLQFLPGMGVYTISETIYNGNSTKYPYTRYEYTSTFLGYVVDTSIDSRTEYVQKYTTDSSSFAYKSPKDSQYSEYYLYVLLDPALDTAEKIDSVYNLLETQSSSSPLHLVFDASASTDHNDYTTEIHRVGYTDSKYPFDYRRTEVNTNYSLTPDESNLTNQLVTTVEQNRWSQTTINNTTNGTISYFEDYTLSSTLNSVDAMMGLNCSNVIIRKPCLNKTLPGYGFQYRLACATMTEPCVRTLVDSEGTSHKLFVTGDYDYYYRKELRTKTVSQHRVGLDERQQNEYNLTNYTSIHPESNHNGPTVNPYERIAHANTIDTNRTDTPYVADKTAHVPFRRMFQSGEYVRLLDVQRTTPMYSSGRSYNQLVKSQQSGQPMTEKTGPSQSIVRVLQGQMIPSLPLSTIVSNPMGSFGLNQTLLDIDYVADEMESVAWVPTRLKHCPRALPLVGNSSTASDSLSPSSASSPYASFTVLQSYVSVGTGSGITYLEIDNKNQYVSQTELNRYFFHSVCVMNTQVVYTHSATGKLTYVASFDQTSEKPQWNIIEEAVFNISKTKIRLRLRNTVLNPTKLANTLIFVPYKAVQIELRTPYNSRMYVATDDLAWIQPNDIVVYRFGTSAMKTLRITSASTVDSETGDNFFTVDNSLPLPGNPENDYVVILRNPFDTVVEPAVDIRYSCLTTQPIYTEGQWYTRIYYSSQHPNPWKLTTYDSQPRIWLETAQKNPSLYDPRISYRLFCHSMMGIQLPFYPLYREQTKRLNGTWVFDTDYPVAGPMENQYIDTRNPVGSYSISPSSIPGRYRTPQESLQRCMMGEFDRGNTSSERDWVKGNDETYPYVVVKGLYMGYGGYVEERHDSDIIQTIFNNDIGWKIEKITELSSRQYLFFKLANEYSDLVRPFIGTSSIQVKTRCRIDNLPVDITLQNIELLLQTLETSSDTDLKYYSDFTLFGSSGHLMKRKITSPYNFNPDNYIYMVVPELNHLETVQTDLKTTAFAKIVLPGETNKVLYNTFIAGSKVYYDTLYNDLNELEVAFVTNDGNLFDFNGYEHSFTLEITEIMDKFEYINTSSGNLEY